MYSHCRRISEWDIDDQKEEISSYYNPTAPNDARIQRFNISVSTLLNFIF